MKLVIVDHARVKVPRALIPSEKPKEAEAPKGLASRTKVMVRRSLGIVSSASFIASPTFLILSEMVPFIASAGVLVATGGAMVAMRDREVRDFFPKFKEEEMEEEIPKKVNFTPYANWDNAFLPYAGEIVNLGYNPKQRISSPTILGGSCMEDLRVWSNITKSESERRSMLKHLYGEVTRTGSFWTKGSYDEVVRFDEELTT